MHRLARAGRLCAATTFSTSSTSPPLREPPGRRPVSVIVQQLFNQLLQVTATAVEDLDNLLLLRVRGPATRSANSSVPSRILANGFQLMRQMAKKLMPLRLQPRRRSLSQMMRLPTDRSSRGPVNNAASSSDFLPQLIDHSFDAFHRANHAGEE